MRQHSVITGIFLGTLFTIAGMGPVRSQNPNPVTAPTVIPPSPDAQAFMRYGDIPVDHSTGVPKIELPIYEVKSGKLSLPISLSYHASGIRVNDIASVAGLGWKLNAGGVLTRTVKGRADDSPHGMLSTMYMTKSQIDNAPLNGTVYGLLKQQSRTQIDNQSDNYYYSAGNDLAGQFIYDNGANLVSLEYTTDKIIKHTVSVVQGSQFYYEVIKDDGTRYIFDQQERTLFDSEFYASSWWLSKIISADGADTISLEYQQYATFYADKQISQSWTFGINQANLGETGMIPSFYQTNTYSLLLTKISFNNGYLQFNYSNDRQDIRDSRLTSIGLYSSANTLLKKFQLDQSYFYSGFANNKFNYRLRLDGLEVQDGSSVLMDKYGFSYNLDNILPPYLDASQNTYQPGVYAIDYWGYFNGQYNNPHLIPNLPAPRATANRVPNTTYAQACILKKITYPTGGTTSFAYESNVTSDGAIGGGLRVKSITSQADPGSPAMTKHYTYQNNLLSSSLDSYNIYTYQQDAISINYTTCAAWTNSSTIYMENPVVPLVSHNGSSAIYQLVTEYTDSASNSMKTEYNYTTEADIVWNVNFPRYWDEYPIDRSWRKGLLAGINYYRRNADGTYKNVKTVGYIYGDYRTSTVIAGTLVQQQISTPSTSACFADNYPGSAFSSLFYYLDVMVEVGVKKVVQEVNTETDDQNNAITTTKNYVYASPNHLFPTTTDYTNSKGDKISTINKYPNDFSGTAVYNALIARNTLSPVVQALKYKNDNVFLESTLTNYRDWGNNILTPETVQTQEFSAPVQTRLRYSAYDTKGNIVTVAKEGDVLSTYLWGYNRAYPVASITNAAAKDVYYNSFEEGTGNSADGDSKTGRKSITTGLSAALSNLTNGAYLLTYWQKSAGVWSLQSQNVTVSSGTYTISLTGQLDEVRFYPAGARLTTYTFDPLIGMTSQCDINNYITYFEYDSFGRLIRVRDKDRNILKQFDYKYLASVGFFNDPQSGTFTKSDCGINFRGTPVTYTVPAGTYTSSSVSTANTMATNDVSANGQAYANAHGACVPTNLFYNVVKTGTFYRNNCSTGYVGTMVYYNVIAGTYTSTVSQDIVDNQAQADVDANGQNYANAHGSCILPIVNVQCTNFTAQAFSATYTNVSTGNVYHFSISGNTTAAALGQMPFGTYNVTISPTGGSALYDFNITAIRQLG